MPTFSKISDANLLAFKNNSRQAEVVAKKQEILDSISASHNITPTSALFVGFSSFVLADFAEKIYITKIGTDVQDYLKSQNIDFEYISDADLEKYHKAFQVVVAVDEYFTYATDDQDQKDTVAEICDLAQDLVITTLRDYKNQDYKDREFSQPSLVRNDKDSLIFLESHVWNPKDRARWDSIIYAISQATNGLTTFGKFDRHTMYFKQLANFSATAGATDFLVHKNLMYKGLVKKNYEHVITIKFD